MALNTRRTTMTTERRRNRMCKSSSALRIQYSLAICVHLNIARIDCTGSLEMRVGPSCCLVASNTFIVVTRRHSFFFRHFSFFVEPQETVWTEWMDFHLVFGISNAMKCGTACVRPRHEMHEMHRPKCTFKLNWFEYRGFCGRARTSERSSLTHFVSIIYWKFSTIGCAATARAEPLLIIEREFLKRFIPNLHWSRCRWLYLFFVCFFFLCALRCRALLISSISCYQWANDLAFPFLSLLQFYFFFSFNWNEYGLDWNFMCGALALYWRNAARGKPNNGFLQHLQDICRRSAATRNVVHSASIVASISILSSMQLRASYNRAQENRLKF